MVELTTQHLEKEKIAKSGVFLMRKQQPCTSAEDCAGSLFVAFAFQRPVGPIRSLITTIRSEALPDWVASSK